MTYRFLSIALAGKMNKEVPDWLKEIGFVITPQKQTGEATIDPYIDLEKDVWLLNGQAKKFSNTWNFYNLSRILMDLSKIQSKSENFAIGSKNKIADSSSELEIPSISLDLENNGFVDDMFRFVNKNNLTSVKGYNLVSISETASDSYERNWGGGEGTSSVEIGSNRTTVTLLKDQIEISLHTLSIDIVVPLSEVKNVQDLQKLISNHLKKNLI